MHGTVRDWWAATQAIYSARVTEQVETRRATPHQRATAPKDALAGFLAARRFPALDGLRAIAVLLVLTWHQGDSLWRPLRGYLGVTIFFVISGFLITTLLIREERTCLGSGVSFRGFYIRRAFRILPLYYVAFLANVVLVYVMHLSSSEATFTHNLRYFLTYTNEFDRPGTFGHTWSLGVEEKFYFVWPLLAFGALHLRRMRVVVAPMLLVFAVGCTWIGPLHYFAVYVPILAGCFLAITVHSDLGGRVVQAFARTPVAVLGIALVVWSASDATDSHVHTWFALTVVIALPCVVFGRGPIAWCLALPPIAWVGRRSYAVYLFHPIVQSAVDDKVSAVGSAHAVERFVTISAVSLITAEILTRLIEVPLINVGRRLSRTEARGTVLPAQ